MQRAVRTSGRTSSSLWLNGSTRQKSRPSQLYQVWLLHCMSGLGLSPAACCTGHTWYGFPDSCTCADGLACLFMPHILVCVYQVPMLAAEEQESSLRASYMKKQGSASMDQVSC